MARSSLDRSLREPLYLQLAALLREQIISGEIPPHHFIPFAQRLCQELEISHTTVDRATAILKEARMIREEKGRGLYVTDPADWVIPEDR